MPCRDGYGAFTPESRLGHDRDGMDELVRRLGENLQLKAKGTRGKTPVRRACPYWVPSRRLVAPGPGPTGCSKGKGGHVRVVSGKEGDEQREFLRQLVLSGNLIKEAVQRLQSASLCCFESPVSSRDSTNILWTPRPGVLVVRRA